MLTPEKLVALLDKPARLAHMASAVRQEHLGPAIAIRATETPTTSPWPAPGDAAKRAELAVAVAPTPDARSAFATWLLELAAEGTAVRLAPCSTLAAGLHPLWCIAAARLVLPATARVEARHDLLGIRLAQVALGFGADTFSGPIEPDRKLPLAGITRPSENTYAGIATLIRQAGLQPTESP